ncbi:adenosylcobinamide-GDP ribazoletransferase [Azospirillum thermophilum]|uniref:Adenosylcobinamide-GDP ribazoletransferase n=1 Tax=Azospirillum thermophilum TaxID=2202148 RepID=A0A2S2CPF2_9PROT|nr:adenosylcobinamide-GDP ribazoletransferase [Azospirillum thermophilum]AWK86329.1 adenosylcobinamide-GDP ribazoletransferase [Azospirillum thermophilum]
MAQDAALALVFLTRIPLPLRGPLADGAAARAIAWFPAVGALVGLAGGAAYALAGLLSLPPPVAALLALAAMVWLTGGLHEDGAADVADGFGGGRSTARKLEIMRDSRVGSYGVLALLLSLSLRAAAIAALAEPGAVAAALIAAGALSRAGLAPMARLMPPARRDGLGAAQGRPPVRTVALALLLGLLPAVGAAGWAGLAAAVAAGTAALLVGRSAIRQIGGQTGDVYGAAQQLGEVAVLLTLVALR